MRILIYLVVIGGVLGGGWVWLNRDRTDEIAAAQAKAVQAKRALGIRTFLREHEVYEFGSIVLGVSDADGAIDFRGQVARSGRMTPAYGKMRALCEDGLEQKTCWELVYLEADGQEVDLGGAPAETEQGSETQTEATTTETTSETAQPTAEAETATETAAVEQPAAAATTETTTQDQPAAPPPTHRVARALINTRSGPGTENPVVTRLTQGAQLALLEEQGGWGRFIVLDGEARGTEVWAALSILEAL